MVCKNHQPVSKTTETARQQQFSPSLAAKQLSFFKLERILQVNRIRLRRFSWEGQSPEQQRRIRAFVDAAAITLRRENG